MHHSSSQELLLITWGLVFVATGGSPPHLKARNFRKSYKRGKDLLYSVSTRPTSRNFTRTVGSSSSSSTGRESFRCGQSQTTMRTHPRLKDDDSVIVEMEEGHEEQVRASLNDEGVGCRDKGGGVPSPVW